MNNEMHLIGMIGKRVTVKDHGIVGVIDSICFKRGNKVWLSVEYVANGVVTERYFGEEELEIQTTP